MFESSSVSCFEGAILVLPCTDVVSVASALIVSCSAKVVGTLKVVSTLKVVVLASITMVLASTLRLLM